MVCVDGSKEAENAFMFALQNTNKEEPLLIAHSKKAPYFTGPGLMKDQEMTEIEKTQSVQKKFEALCKQHGVCDIGW